MYRKKKWGFPSWNTEQLQRKEFSKRASGISTAQDAAPKSDINNPDQRLQFPISFSVSSLKYGQQRTIKIWRKPPRERDQEKQTKNCPGRDRNKGEKNKTKLF